MDLRTAEEFAKSSKNKKRRRTEPETVPRWLTSEDGSKIANPSCIDSDVDDEDIEEEVDGAADD